MLGIKHTLVCLIFSGTKMYLVKNLAWTLAKVTREIDRKILLHRKMVKIRLKI